MIERDFPITPDNLHLPEKYRVLVGQGSSVAVCVGWRKLEDETGSTPVAEEVLPHVALLGNLYSRGGLNYILRNLALNPGITTLGIWDRDSLSKTEFGRAGLSLLRQLWQQGLDDEGRIVGTEFKLESEIEPQIAREIIRNVVLVELGNSDLEGVINWLQGNKTRHSPYMNPVRFPEAQRQEIETYPSEEVGWLVRGKTVVDVWLQVLDRIMRYGTIKPTEYGIRARELLDVLWLIEGEDLQDPFLPEWLDITTEALKEYGAIFLGSTLPEGVAYTYGNRLRAWPGSEGPIDQVEEMIKHIERAPYTRRAYATTMHPERDINETTPPCIIQVQEMIRNGKVDLFATARSQDLFRAGVPNAFGLLGFQAYLAEQSGYEPGKLSIRTISAHVYEQDWEAAQELLATHYRNRPVSPTFNEEEIDPRGNVLVWVGGDKIHLEMTSPGGVPLPIEIVGTSSEQMIRELILKGWLVEPAHAAYVAIQLERARRCLRTGREFVQDQDPDWSI